MTGTRQWEVVRTTAELDADTARARFSLALNNMELTKGQRLRLADLASHWARLSRDAGMERGQANARMDRS